MAIVWIGAHNGKAGRKAVSERMRVILSDNLPGCWGELSQGALTLGKLHDPGSADLVHRICAELPRHVARAGFCTADVDCIGLFAAYRGLALLGHKKDALAELKRIYDREKARMEPLEKKEFEQQLAAAEKW